MKRREQETQSRFAHLEWFSCVLEDLLRHREEGLPCSLCSRRADVFRLGPAYALLCLECSTEPGDWHSVEGLFADFLADLTAMRNASVILLGLQALARHTSEGAGSHPAVAAVSERLAEDGLYLIRLVGRLRRTAAAYGCDLPEDGFFKVVADVR